MATVRIIVDDVDHAASFSIRYLGFELEEQRGPAIAILSDPCGNPLELFEPVR